MDALIEGILVDPDADGPRLVYADWLESQGDLTRARFVRAQLARAHLPVWDLRHVALRNEEDETRPEMPALVGATLTGWRRGLPEVASVREFSSLEAVAERLGTVGASTLEIGWPRSADDARKARPVPGLRRVRLVTWLSRLDKALRWGLASPLLQDIRELEIPDAGLLGADDVDALIASPVWSGLRRLQLGAQIHEADLARLLDGLPAGLRELGFAVSVPIPGQDGRVWEEDSRGLLQLADWPGLSQIERLDLVALRPGDDGLAAVLDAPTVGGVRDLGLQVIARTATFPVSAASPLRPSVLRLEHCELGRRIGQDLAGAACLSGLRMLDLREARLSAASAFGSMFAGPLAESVEVVQGDGNLDGIVGGLARGRMKRLHTLKLSAYLGSRVVDQLQALLRTPGASTLRELSLTQSPRMTPETVLEIVGCTELQRLQVAAAQWTADEEAAFAVDPGVQRLRDMGGLGLHVPDS